MDRAALDPGDGSNAVSGARLRRRPPPAWARVPSSVLVYAIGVPLVRLLELVGVWPRLMSRAMARMKRKAPRYAPSARDVLVCSYFKTGTNWTMQIALQIAHRGHAVYDHIHDLVPWLEMPPEMGYTVPLEVETWRSAPTSLRVIKTHLAFDELVYDPSARYIWVVRDPKDVFVSSYHFMRATILGPLAPSVRSWLDLYLSPDTFIGSWAEHLDGGWRNRRRDNVLFLTYEEMKTDLRLTVQRIAKFMNVELTPDELDSVVEQSSYAHMKANGHKFDTIGLSPPWAKPQGSMVRRGERGVAGELLCADEQRRIDEYWRAELERLGSDFPYDELYKPARPLEPASALRAG
jgi:hypothetical protein